MDLENKLALVTGGGSGIGLGIAQALAAAGAQVIITGRTEEKLRRVAENDFTGAARPPIVRPCDVVDREGILALVASILEEFGPIDILANSAGVNIAQRKMSDLDPANFDRVMSVNATGLFNVMHAVLPSMRERGDGIIFNISSIAGKRALPLAGPAYCASKFAATALGTAVALEDGPNGIRVTNLYPGEVNTPLLEDRPEPVPDEKKAKMVHPEDIGKMVVAIAGLPAHVIVPELIIRPLYQEYL